MNNLFSLFPRYHFKDIAYLFVPCVFQVQNDSGDFKKVDSILNNTVTETGQKAIHWKAVGAVFGSPIIGSFHLDSGPFR